MTPETKFPDCFEIHASEALLCFLLLIAAVWLSPSYCNYCFQKCWDLGNVFPNQRLSTREKIVAHLQLWKVSKVWCLRRSSWKVEMAVRCEDSAVFPHLLVNKGTSSSEWWPRSGEPDQIPALCQEHQWPFKLHIITLPAEKRSAWVSWIPPQLTRVFWASEQVAVQKEELDKVISSASDLRQNHPDFNSNYS